MRTASTFGYVYFRTFLFRDKVLALCCYEFRRAVCLFVFFSFPAANLVWLLEDVEGMKVDAES